jgi:prophage regulatory protein
MARRTIRRRTAAERPPSGFPHPQLPLAMEFPEVPADVPPHARGSSRTRVSPARILRMRDIVQLTGVHRATIHRWIQAGTFPAKDAPRHRPTGWLEATYERWVRGALTPSQRTQLTE